MSRHPEVDLTKIRTVSVESRRSKVGETQSYRPPRDPRSFAGFWDSMPHLLGSDDLRSVVERIAASRRNGRPVIALCGAHVIKTGMGPGLIDWAESGLLTGLALHGAGSVHDVELGLWGRTSEDVAAELHDGRFGMARETASFLNGAAKEAAKGGEGLGEAIGRLLLAADRSSRRRSILAAMSRLGLPATIHVAFGTDIHHQHPSFDGAATGEASARDFRILAAQLMKLRGGTVLNLGSAVILPEVFLKAYSVARNLGGARPPFTTAAFDFIRQYRPVENVVRRPTLRGGQGFYIVGHHEIMLPLLFQAVRLRQREQRSAREQRSNRGGSRKYPNRIP